MANIQKLTYPYFTDGSTQLNAQNLNPIISKMNEMIEAINSGVAPTPTQTVATPTISISGSTATISCSTSGATIYYTLNGNTPTTSSTQYSSPITLSGACTIKAIAVKSGMTNSSVASQSYTPAAQNITFADQATKAIAVRLYDTNNDGEVSTTEATVEKTLTNGTTEDRQFSESAIVTFNEFQYFTGTKVSTAAFKNCASLTSITFPNPVKFMSDDQFSGCANLVLTTLPNFVDDVIPARIFYNCANGVNITEIPARFTAIGNSAFYGCRAMPKVKVLATTPPTLGNNLVFKTQTQNSGDNQFADVYVPDASVNTYKAANIWSEFADHIKPLSTWTN